MTYPVLRASLTASGDYQGFGDRDDELGAPGAHMGELFQDLVLEVPGQDEDVVGLLLVDLRWRMDRNVGSGEKLPLLVRGLVDRELDQIAADPAIVEEGVALPRRAVTRDTLSLFSSADQCLEEAALGPVHLLLKESVPLDPAVTELLFPSAERDHPVAHCSRPIFAVPHPDSQGPAVRPEFLHVEHGHPMDAEYPLGGEQL